MLLTCHRHFVFFQIIYLFIWLCWVFSPVAAHGLLVAVPSLVAEYVLWGGAQVSVVVTCALSSCGSPGSSAQAQ